MVFPNEFSPNEPKDKPSSKKDQKEDISGVIDELRHVLSDLGGEKPPQPMDGHVPPPAFAAPTQPLVETPSVLDETMFRPLPTLDPSPTGNPSDSDFWSGNVLGWPKSDEETTESNGHNVNPLKEPITEPVDEPEPMVGLPLLEEPSRDMNPFDFPPPPVSPASASPVPEFPTDPFLFNSVDRAPAAKFPPEPPPPPKMKPPPPVLDEIPSSFSVPLPGTINEEFVSPNLGNRQVEVPMKPENDSFDLEQTELKPKGLIHIACFYPQGEEKLGQVFVSKVREAGSKAKNKLDIQQVFIYGWTPRQVDVVAWEKSAVLSGADFMFVLASKKDQAKFSDLSKSSPGNKIKKRLIFLEQIGLRNLIADVLAELGRVV